MLMDSYLFYIFSTLLVPFMFSPHFSRVFSISKSQLNIWKAITKCRITKKRERDHYDEEYFPHYEQKE